MAVGSVNLPKMPEIQGIKLGAACAGIKQTLKDDLLVIALDEGSSCAGVFTRNAFCAAPVQVAKTHLGQAPRWLLVNSGNANAGTGRQGMQDALETCAQLAPLVGGKPEQVLPFSTGVIGQALPVDKVVSALPAAVSGLSGGHWDKAAHAIMTTDTFAKGVAHSIHIDGHTIRFNGIAKWAGMIQPDMATMLAFIGTDAKIDQNLLQACLAAAAEQSFNRITVDGDTSTNDALIVMATGQSSAPEIIAGSKAFELFSGALLSVCKQLAELIVRDGEGATKLIRIVVSEASTNEEAVRVGKTIAHSPLVKTAFFASDPNWGRILAAVGRAGVNGLVLDAVHIFLDDVCIVSNGGRAETYTEEAGQRVMAQPEISVTVKLGRGTACQEVLTCDFSYDYVKINAEYRT